MQLCANQVIIKNGKDVSKMKMLNINLNKISGENNCFAHVIKRK